MKKVSLLLKATFLLVSSPLEISKGQRRRAVMKAKKLYASVNLF